MNLSTGCGGEGAGSRPCRRHCTAETSPLCGQQTFQSPSDRRATQNKSSTNDIVFVVLVLTFSCCLHVILGPSLPVPFPVALLSLPGPFRFVPSPFLSRFLFPFFCPWPLPFYSNPFLSGVFEPRQNIASLTVNLWHSCGFRPISERSIPSVSQSRTSSNQQMMRSPMWPAHAKHIMRPRGWRPARYQLQSDRTCEQGGLPRTTTDRVGSYVGRSGRAKMGG